MAKKAYSAPVVKTEEVAFGVFGSYGIGGNFGGFKMPPIRGIIRRFFRWF